MVTYSLTPEQSLIHAQGSRAETDRLAAAIIETMEAVGVVEDVLVLATDGSIAYLLEMAPR